MNCFSEPRRGPEPQQDIPKGSVIVCPGCHKFLFMAAKDIQCFDSVSEETLEAIGNAKIPGPWKPIECSFCGAELFNENGELLYVERLRGTADPASAQ